MNSKQLEKLLRDNVHDDVRIKEHPTLVGISNVFWRTYEICPCPTFEVRESFDPSYTYEFPNGFVAAHNSVESITKKLEETISFFSSEEGKQLEADEKKVYKDANVIEIKPLDEGNITV